MRRLRFILVKEFKQIFRNPAILRIIMIMPIVQLIIIPLAADFEVKNLELTVIDQDQTTYSRRLIHKLDASVYFTINQTPQNYQDALQIMGNSDSDIILTIPPEFEKTLVKEGVGNLHLAADAVNGIKAGLGIAYSRNIIQDFNQQIREELMPGRIPANPITINTNQWYNPHNDYHMFMVPGILAILVTMVGSFLAALNIVAEKEVGTIEQLNVTPVRKYQFILGKLIPFWVLGIISISIGIVVAKIVFNLWPVGSILTIWSVAAIYLLSVLGIGLLVSTFADTQQQATLFAFFFMMIFILMGGLFTPVESMPEWAQVISSINPPTYFIRAIRAIYIKGSGLYDLRYDLLIIALIALVFNLLAVWNYRKRT